MKLTRVSIKNYKSISPEGIEIRFRERFIGLVGKNNAGKSNVLDAISLLFGQKNPRYLQIESSAFNDPASPIDIEAEIEGVDFGAGKSIGLSDKQCHMLTKVDKKGEKVPEHITLRLRVPPGAIGGEEANESEPSATEEPAQEEEKQTFALYLANNHEVKRNEDIRKALVKYLLVPPLRAHSDILSPSAWTPYGRMLRDILAESAEAEDLRQFIRDATNKLRNVLKTEAETLSQSAQTTAYVDSVDFQLTREGDPAELLRNLSLSIQYGGRSEDISDIGTGTQSAVIIGILELCLRHRHRRGIRLFAVEEPELFLHPHAQRHVAMLLRRIADEEGSQVILTTHSPSVLSDLDIIDVVRVDRDTSKATRCSRVPDDFTGLSQAERLLGPEACEMLFADRVVLVEGPSEVELLPRLAPHVKTKAGDRNCDFDRLNVSIFSVGGKTHFSPYVELLESLNIEWRIICDSDALSGSALDGFKKRFGINTSEDIEKQREALLRHGIAVLGHGEIEDYYPHEALAVIAGCLVTDVSKEIERHRIILDMPTSLEIVRAVVMDNTEAITYTKKERLPKLAEVWHSQAVEKIRSGGSVERRRKTSDAVAEWLKRPKPAIAQEVARWIVAHWEVPERLARLIQWAAT
ncbi:MAG: hypothetical protein COT35_00940 [Nitrospirae bacterium CG08_land_8_20_14_0_20_52_24]|nr:MAG: hypothetical protein COT35_00940 [Nitrospirae bacterium CG08_land_8_20_14_0_20_52_24]PIV82432.1 MAG: hypothetical protein COW52_13650 [Nitrospirae bacterium CG17_big_fil_post_rev_8_21_14_2_50_50_9]PIW85907.1 MAG: hypothetical protein COZ95_02095 [Nitrospirae bacterium CG_4_8_14_3_um_filter_50_41]